MNALTQKVFLNNTCSTDGAACYNDSLGIVDF